MVETKVTPGPRTLRRRFAYLACLCVKLRVQPFWQPAAGPDIRTHGSVLGGLETTLPRSQCQCFVDNRNNFTAFALRRIAVIARKKNHDALTFRKNTSESRRKTENATPQTSVVLQYFAD